MRKKKRADVQRIPADLIAQAIVIHERRRILRDLKAELADTKLQLIGATLASELTDVDLVTRASIDSHLERVRELVREVAR